LYLFLFDGCVLLGCLIARLFAYRGLAGLGLSLFIFGGKSVN